MKCCTTLIFIFNQFNTCTRQIMYNAESVYSTSHRLKSKRTMTHFQNSSVQLNIQLNNGKKNSLPECSLQQCTYLYLVIPLNRHHRRGGDHERGERLNSGATEEARTPCGDTYSEQRSKSTEMAKDHYSDTTTGAAITQVATSMSSEQRSAKWSDTAKLRPKKRQRPPSGVTTPIVTKGHESDQMTLELPEAT